MEDNEPQFVDDSKSAFSFDSSSRKTIRSDTLYLGSILRRKTEGPEPTIYYGALKSAEEYSQLTESSEQTSVEEPSESIETGRRSVFKEPIRESEIHISESKPKSIFDNYCEEAHSHKYPGISLMRPVFEQKTDILDLSFYASDEINLHLIAKTLTENRINNIRVINFSHNHFGKAACSTLAQYLELSSVVELNLEHCEIGSEGIQTLAEGLEFAQYLEILNISHCNLRDAGGVTIANMLSKNEVIQKIDLSHNKLEAQSGIEFGKTFQANSTLTHVNLRWNNLYFPKGFSKLSAGLGKNKTITHLDLSWNGLVGEACSSGLAKVLRVNKSLEVVHIENNIFAPTELTEIVESVKKSKTMQEFYMGGNFITDDVVKAAVTGQPIYRLISFGEYYYTSDLKIIKEIAKFKWKNPHIKLIYHDNVLPNPPEPIDIRDIFLSRAKIVAEKPKKKKLRKDMGHFMIELADLDVDYMKVEEFREKLNNFKAKLDHDLKDGFIEAFTVKVLIGNKKVSRIEVRKMAEQYLRKFSTERPPPSPPKVPRGKKKVEEPPADGAQ